MRSYSSKVRDELSVLSAILAVAEERSVTRAAKRLGVSPSALSHAIRGLEERIGVRLLARTTRSVAPAEAGEQFIARLGPALADVHGALAQIAGLRDKPAGRVRLVASRLAARMVLAPKLGQFARDYVCSRTGARRSPATFSTTRAGGSSRRRSLPSSRCCGYSARFWNGNPPCPCPISDRPSSAGARGSARRAPSICDAARSISRRSSAVS